VPIRKELVDEIDQNGTAYLMMLIRASAGSDSCKLNGRKKDLALMWAAARLFDIDVKDYEPDAFALEVHQNMKRQYQEARP